jgi:hypothetical protein
MLTTLALRPLGPPGVFVTHPGAAFDRLALARVGDIGHERGAAFTVVAQDRHTVTLRLWSLRGNVVAALTPPADTVVLVSGRPIVSHRGRAS